MGKIDINLAKKTGLYFIGNFASKIIMAIMVPIYAYFVSVEELGIFNYSQILMNIISPIVFFAIWESILRLLVAEKDIEKINNVIATSLRFVLVIIIILFTICVLLAFNSNKVIMYTMIMISTYGVAQIWQYYARALKFNQTFVFASVTGTAVNFAILIITVVFLNLGASGLFWSFICGQISIVLLIESKIGVFKQSLIGSFHWSLLKRMLTFSIPLVLNLTSNWLIAGFGKIIIMKQLGAFENGLYSFAMNFGTIITMLGSVISMALIEEAIIKSEEKEIGEYFSNVIESVFKLFLSICIIAIPGIAFFYYFISKTEYYQSYELIPLFIIYAVIITMSTNVGAIFQAKNKTNLLFYTTACGAFVTILLAYFVIDLWGLKGVAISQIFGALIMLIMRWIYAKKLITFKIKWNKISLLIIIYILVVFVCVNGINIVSTSICIFVLFVIIYINKDLIDGMKKLKKKNSNHEL